MARSELNLPIYSLYGSGQVSSRRHEFCSYLRGRADGFLNEFILVQVRLINHRERGDVCEILNESWRSVYMTVDTYRSRSHQRAGSNRLA